MGVNRYGFTNRYVTTLASDHDLNVGVDGVLPLVNSPVDIEDGKMFFVVFNVEDVVNRVVLPVYMDGGNVRYNGYDVQTFTELKKYDTCMLNDVAEIFNLLFKLTDDFGFVKHIGGLDVIVYGGNTVIGNQLHVIPDTALLLTDDTTNYIVIDYLTATIQTTTVLSGAQYLLNTIVTSGGDIISNDSNKGFNVQDFFSTSYFEYDVSKYIKIKHQRSISANADGLQLVNDVTSPGLNKVYGTHPVTGVKGWYDNTGADGRDIELQNNGTFVQWRYVGDVAWINLIALSSISGTNGTNGTDGRDIELQANLTHIQWRYVGDVTWIDLVALSDITGPQGLPGGVNDNATLTTGTADDYEMARAGYANYGDRDIFIFQPHITNNAGPTMDIESLGPKDIVDTNGDPLDVGILNPNTAYFIMYNLSLDALVIVGSIGGSGTTILNIATDSDDQIYNGTDVDRVLPSTPLSLDSIWIKTDSGTLLIRGVDYSLDLPTKTITWIINPNDGEGLYAGWLVSSGIVGQGSMMKKPHTRSAGGGDTSEVIVDADILSDSIITGWTITSGTQVGIWEFDLSTPGQITINSSASETGDIDFVYSYII